jgi:DNA-binding YbaB/EbfC family protein
MNINELMKQAQRMQKKFQDAQEEIAKMEVNGNSGGGLVKYTMTADGRAKKIKIDPNLFSDGSSIEEQIEIVEDLIIAAINSAKDTAESETQKKMQDLTGGMGLPPGFKMPF